MAKRPPASDPSPSASHGGGSTPGLGEQFGRTRDAVFGLVSAHVKLLSAELSDIMGEIKRDLALAAAALGLVIVGALLLSIGTVLWLDEWAFGSIGWGALHGFTFMIATAVTLALLIIPNSIPRLALAFFVSLVVAAVVGAIFWLQLTSRAWGWVGDTFFGGLAWPNGQAVALPDRPVVAAVIVLAVLFAVIGALVGLAFGSGFLGRVGGVLGGALVGALVGGALGGLLGVPMSWGCAVAVGLAFFFILMPILGLVFVLPGADWGELKKRLLPTQTIETTKETIEWVREQMPLGRKS